MNLSRKPCPLGPDSNVHSSTKEKTVTKEKDISVDYLRTRLRYEPETGKLFWLDSEDMPKRWRTRWAGKEAFTAAHNCGYKQGDVLSNKFLAHRVAWALHYGEWPSNQIDHTNGIRDDNRIENLRGVSPQENQANRRMNSNNKSGVVGVFWHKVCKKWAANIQYNGKGIYLGSFDCIGQAIKARREAEKLYGFHENHGRR